MITHSIDAASAHVPTIFTHQQLANLAPGAKLKSLCVVLLRLAILPLLAASLPVYAGDSDADGIPDGVDNCRLIANVDQRDTNGDGFGNRCDPDLNNDGLVNFADLDLLKAVFFGTDADADLDGDGRVNFADLNITKAFFFGPPGPGADCTAGHGFSPVTNQACPVPGEDCDSAPVEWPVDLAGCEGADRLEVWVDGVSAAVNSNPVPGLNIVVVDLPNGYSTIQARVFSGSNLIADSNNFLVFADLYDPLVSFVNPPAGSLVVYGEGDDADPVAPGFQIAVVFDASDGDSLSGWELRGDGNLLASGTFDENPDSVSHVVSVAPEPFETIEIEVIAADAVGNTSSSAFEAEFNFVSCSVSLYPQGFFDLAGNDVCIVPGEDCESAFIDLDVWWSCTGTAADRIELLRDGVLEATFTTEPDPGPTTTSFSVPIAHAASHVFGARAFAGSTEVGSAANRPVSADFHDPVASFTSPPAGTLVEYTMADDVFFSDPGLQVLLTLEAGDADSSLDDWVIILDDGSTTTELASGSFTTNPQTLSNIEVTLPTTSPSFTIRAIVRDQAGNETTTEFSGVLTCPVSLGAPFDSSTASVGNEFCPTAGDDCEAVTFDLDVLFDLCVGPVERVELYRNGLLETTVQNPATGSVSFPVSIAHGETHTFQAAVIAGAVEGQANIEVLADLHDPYAMFISPPDGAVVGYTGADDASPAPGFQILVTLEASDENAPLNDWVITEDDGSTFIELANGFFVTNPETLSDIELTLPLQIFPDFRIQAVVRDLAGNETTTYFYGFFDI